MRSLEALFDLAAQHVHSIKPDSSLGSPWATAYGNYEDAAAFLEDHAVLLCQVVAARLYIGQFIDWAAVDASPVEETSRIFTRIGFFDPCRLFIKNEPTKDSKVREGRYRLIHHVGIGWNLWERIVFSGQFKMDKMMAREQEPQVGQGLNDHDSAALRARLQEFGVVRDNDASSWDFSVPGKLVRHGEMVCGILAEDPIGPKPKRQHSWYANALEAQCSYLTRRSYVTSSGVLYTPLYEQGQASGSLGTSNKNAYNRMALAVETGVASRAFVQGDDCIEDMLVSQKEAERIYHEAGMKITYSDPPEGVVCEFCSQYLTESGLYVPTGLAKAAYNVLAKPPTTEASLSACQSLSINFRHQPTVPLAVMAVNLITGC